MNRKIWFVLLALIIVLATGCANKATSVPPPAPAPTPAPPTPPPPAPAPVPAPGPAHPVKGTFIEGSVGGDAETLNYLLAADASSFSYVGQVIDGLATYDNQWQVVLRVLAKPVEISPDGLTYTMTIRDDLHWSDGVKVTAEDYVYTLKNLMFSDWLNYPYQSDWQEMVNGETVFVDPEVVNDTTFTIKRQTVDPEFVDNAIYGLTAYPRHIAEKYEGDAKAFTQAEEFNNLSYTGNLGPYRYKEWIRDDKFVTERNPEFYLGQEDGSPYFEQYEIKLFGTSAAMYAALEAGDIQYAGIEPEQVAKFKAMPEVNVYTTPTRSYDLIVLNLRNNGWEGLDSKDVRQALSMSISKQAVIEDIRLGFGDPAFSFIPSSSPWYTDTGVPTYGYGALYDKEKAKEMLLNAGYGARQADGSIKIQGKNGQPLKLTLATTPGSAVAENLAYLVKQELGDIGIDVDIKLVPWATLLRQYVMNKVPGSDQQPGYNNGPEAVSEEPWDMIIMVFSTHPIAPSGSRVFFTGEGGLNYWGYDNPKVDELFQRVTSAEALDSDVRKEIYGELSRTIAEDQSVIFLTYPRANHGFRTNVEGIDVGMRLGWNSYKWYFAEP